MSHFLERLLEKQTDPELIIQPRLPARFEPFSTAGEEEGSSMRLMTGSTPSPEIALAETPPSGIEEKAIVSEIPLREIIRERQTTIQQLHMLQPNDNESLTTPAQPQVIIQRLVADSDNQRRRPPPINEQLSALSLPGVQETAVSHPPPLPSPQPVVFQAVAAPPKAKQDREQETAVTPRAKINVSTMPLPSPFAQKPQSDLPVKRRNQIFPASQEKNNHFQLRRNSFAKEKLAMAADKANAPTTIQVTIGRVEVRATSVTQPSKRPQKAANIMSLDDYLQQRGGKS